MLKTFHRGGIHPEENKLTAQVPLERFPVPAKVVLFLGQSLGAPARPLVEKGSQVLAGQLIAQGESLISAHLHSPISGTVTHIDDHLDFNGYRRKAIFIDVQGDQWDPAIDRSETLISQIPFSQQELLAKIKQMGIVGLGGACFPTHVKLSVPEGKRADYLLVNAAECEPYLTSDHRLLLEKTAELVVGARILMKACGAKRAVFGVENNKPDCISALRKAIGNETNLEVIPLKTRYPQGAEKMLIKAMTGRAVPPGKLPVDVGCVVNNVGTAFAVYEAVQKNKPLFESMVTVTGKGLSKQVNYVVRLGTSYSEILSHVGPLPEGDLKIVRGGPMMGKAMTTLDAPVTKGASAILVLSGKEAKRVPEVNCIRCGRCVSVCPMRLEPYLFERLVANKTWEAAEQNHIMDCMECGCCQYTCPSGRQLLDSIRLGKNNVGQLIRSRGIK